MGEAARKRITVDEFLVWEGEGDRRYELFGGEIVAMAPPASYHGAIVANTIVAIKRSLRPPCQAISEAGVILPWRNDTYYQADLAVTCSPIRAGTWATPNPVVIVEVLSPSTAGQDRGIKLFDYRHIESVQEIIVVASDKKSVEHWRRGDGVWTLHDLGPGDHLDLTSIGSDFLVDTLYEGLDFSLGAAAENS